MRWPAGWPCELSSAMPSGLPDAPGVPTQRALIAWLFIVKAGTPGTQHGSGLAYSEVTTGTPELNLMT